MCRMLGANRSLKTLVMTRSVKLAIEVSIDLLNAIGGHRELQKVTIENAKVACSTERQFEELKDTIVAMASQNSSKLRELIFETLSTLLQRMSEQETNLKMQLVRHLQAKLPQLQHIKF